jgi:hypothetical protein
MAVPKNYETGMKVVFDEKSKAVSVTFRGRRHELKGPFESECEGIKAGQNHCRKLGWDCSSPDPRTGRSILSRQRPL